MLQINPIGKSQYAKDFQEEIDLTVEPWATLAPLCWNEPSPFRLGGQAEKHGVFLNPYSKPNTRSLFEEGRVSYRVAHGIKPTVPQRGSA